MRLADLIDHLDSWYDPRWAESWDRVGLVCGDPDREVRRVLLAVDPALEVVDEAVAYGADLVIVHHPLLLTPVSSVAATSPKGQVVHRLIQNGTALFTAHTNADVPVEGVNHAIADALGLRDAQVLSATDGGGLDKLVTFVPAGDAEVVRRSITAAGAGAIGAYDSCTFTTPGEGRFRPLEGADPTIGTVGEVEVVEEVRVEVVLPRSRRSQVVRAMLAVHPYEEPAYDLYETADAGISTTGTGRIGDVAPTTLRGFAEQVTGALPPTAHGVRVGGDPDREVRRVAVCGGSGDFLLDRVRAGGADVYVTSDLRHHPASEFLEHGGPALVDVAHWAAEWTWLPVVERRVKEAIGDTVGTRVSTTCTDPWTFRV